MPLQKVLRQGKEIFCLDFYRHNIPLPDGQELIEDNTLVDDQAFAEVINDINLTLIKLFSSGSIYRAYIDDLKVSFYLLVDNKSTFAETFLIEGFDKSQAFDKLDKFYLNFSDGLWEEQDKRLKA